MSIHTVNSLIPSDLKQKNAEALKRRHQSWRKNAQIPKSIDIEHVDLDQFFTRAEVAQECWVILKNLMRQDGVQLSTYTFIEPSAGLGAFYQCLPPQQRIGIDVVAFNPDYIQSEFLGWRPENKAQQYICVGNPPFGARGWLALLFLNHAATFCDYVAFILPMGFQSSGQKNALAARVKGLNLVHSSQLPPGSFINNQGKQSTIHTLWQIWSAKTSVPKEAIKRCDQTIDVFTINNDPHRPCGQKRLKEAHCFLQRTFFSKSPRLCMTLAEVKYNACLGIVIKRNKRKALQILKNTDWIQYSNLAINCSRHISLSHVHQALTDQGLCDQF